MKLTSYKCIFLFNIEYIRRPGLQKTTIFACSCVFYTYLIFFCVVNTSRKHLLIFFWYSNISYLLVYHALIKRNCVDYKIWKCTTYCSMMSITMIQKWFSWFYLYFFFNFILYFPVDQPPILGVIIRWIILMFYLCFVLDKT